MALINGFEDVVDYIKKQEQRIMQLEEENKKLKAEDNDEDFEEKAIQYVYEHTDEYDDWVKNSTLYEKLEEENKKLKEQLNLNLK